jgi:hypothetical protein
MMVLPAEPAPDQTNSIQASAKAEMAQSAYVHFRNHEASHRQLSDGGCDSSAFLAFANQVIM